MFLGASAAVPTRSRGLPGLAQSMAMLGRRRPCWWPGRRESTGSSTKPSAAPITLTNGLVIESIALTAADNHGAIYVLIKSSLLAEGVIRRTIAEIYRIACTGKPCKAHLYGLLVNGKTATPNIASRVMRGVCAYSLVRVCASKSNVKTLMKAV